MSDTDSRTTTLLYWLNTDLRLNIDRLDRASGDASFRRYFRIATASGSEIVMDAPPQQENIVQFLKVAEIFSKAGLHVPKIFQQNFAEGFLLLEDFGSQSYLDVLSTHTVNQLYDDALDSLLNMQRRIDINNRQLPEYDRALLQRELELFQQWYVEGLCAIQLTSVELEVLHRTHSLLIENALQQPQVCVHRDFHSRNLMFLTQGNPGIIDFQDAVIGPVTYDLVSLLKDCYIAWPEAQIQQWMNSYYQRLIKNGLANCSPETFLRWFDLMGMQRHLKAIGIFSRLKIRDKKSSYIDDIPRTMKYVATVSDRYSEFSAFADLLHSKLMPALETTS